MSDKPNAPGFSAANIRSQMARRSAERAEEEARHRHEEEERRRALLEEFHKPPARTPEQLQRLVTQLVSQAAERGEHEVQVYRFPSALCRDGGRAINNTEADWENTLVGGGHSSPSRLGAIT